MQKIGIILALVRTVQLIEVLNHSQMTVRNVKHGLCKLLMLTPMTLKIQIWHLKVTIVEILILPNSMLKDRGASNLEELEQKNAH